MAQAYTDVVSSLVLLSFLLCSLAKRIRGNTTLRKAQNCANKPRQPREVYLSCLTVGLVVVSGLVHARTIASGNSYRTETYIARSFVA